MGLTLSRLQECTRRHPYLNITTGFGRVGVGLPPIRRLPVILEAGAKLLLFAVSGTRRILVSKVCSKRVYSAVVLLQHRYTLIFKIGVGDSDALSLLSSGDAT